MCNAFLSEYESNDCVNSTKILKSLIKDRPANEIDLKKIIDEHGKEESHVNEDNNEEQTDDDDVEFCLDNIEKKTKKKRKRTIKEHSPFTKCFLDVENKCKKKSPKSW